MKNDFLKKITTRGRAIYLAYDHGMEHGPDDLPGKSVDPTFILDIAMQGEFNAVILGRGIAEKYYKDSIYEMKVPLILKLNGKANIWKGGDLFSRQNCSVEYAKELGASAVGYTIFLGSAHDEEMFAEFGKIVEDAHHNKMAAIAWVYPRGEFVKDETSPEITAYAARVGLELGADIVKIKYCGSTGNFKKVVEAAGKSKVVLSGGPILEREEEFLGVVRSVILAGGIGAAVGRNVWQNPNPLEFTKRIKDVIFENQ